MIRAALPLLSGHVEDGGAAAGSFKQAFRKSGAFPHIERQSRARELSD